MNMMEIWPRLNERQRYIVRAWLREINQAPPHEVETILVSMEVVRKGAERWFHSFSYKSSETKDVYDFIFGPK